MTSAAGRGATRRDWQKEQTRLDLAMAAYNLAQRDGLAQVRVPQIAAAAGVSTRTFNNYFPSKEAAIVWPTTLRLQRIADDLAARPASEALATALVEVFTGIYAPADHQGLPEGWLDGFRALVASEPALHGEYLKAHADGERALAATIADRTGYAEGALEPVLIAGVTMAAERAAILHWIHQGDRDAPLADAVRTAVATAVGGLAAADVALT